MIGILCPTKRPLGFANMCRTAFEYAEHPDKLHIYAGIDEEDDLTPYFIAQAANRPNQITLVQAQVKGCIEMANRLAEESTADELFIVADDTQFATPRWDSLMMEKTTEDGVYCIYPCVARGDPRCCHFMVSSMWYSTLGFVMHPALRHYYGDSFVEETAKYLQRDIPARDVVLNHLHEDDELNKKNMARYREDSKIWRTEQMQKEIEVAVKRLEQYKRG